MVSVSTCMIKDERVILKPLTQAKVPEETSCWTNLFETAIIAMDLYIEFGSHIFLDTDFQTMIQLAAVEYPVMENRGIILMGYSTALVPMKRLPGSDTVFWHLETGNEDLQLKPTELLGPKGRWMKRRALEDLRSPRVLIGWCQEAVTLLGTELATTVDYSGITKSKKSTMRWVGANLQLNATTAAPFQIGGSAGMAFQRTTNTLRFDTAKNYRKCLNTSAMEQIILYDALESRAWLVSLICVFHEMLIAYWQRNVPAEQRKDNMPLARPHPNGASASLVALRDNGNCIVEGSDKDQLTVRDMILGFSINMSKISPNRPSRSKVFGYEFMDIVMEPTIVPLKKRSIEKEAWAWKSLLSEIKCLFCSQLGDAMLGSRNPSKESECNKLPKGLDWLATSMHSIVALDSRHGNSKSMGYGLSSRHVWVKTGNPFGKCGNCENGVCWTTGSFLQRIRSTHNLKLETSDNTQNQRDSAVVFGLGRIKADFSYDKGSGESRQATSDNSPLYIRRESKFSAGEYAIPRRDAIDQGRGGQICGRLMDELSRFLSGSVCE